MIYPTPPRFGRALFGLDAGVAALVRGPAGCTNVRLEIGSVLPEVVQETRNHAVRPSTPFGSERICQRTDSFEVLDERVLAAVLRKVGNGEATLSGMRGGELCRDPEAGLGRRLVLRPLPRIGLHRRRSPALGAGREIVMDRPLQPSTLAC